MLKIALVVSTLCIFASVCLVSSQTDVCQSITNRTECCDNACGFIECAENATVSGCYNMTTAVGVCPGGTNVCASGNGTTTEVPSTATSTDPDTNGTTTPTVTTTTTVAPTSDISNDTDTTNGTDIPTTTTTTTEQPTTTASDDVTTGAVLPTSTDTTPPDCSGQHFDAGSFIGGMVLSAGIAAIIVFACKFYKSRSEQNYHQF